MALQLNNGVSNEYAFFNGTDIKVANGAMSYCAWVEASNGAATNRWVAGLANDHSADVTSYYMIFGDSADAWQQYERAGGAISYSTAVVTGTWVFLAYSTPNNFSGKQYVGTTTTTTEINSHVSTNAVLNDVIIGARPGLTGLARCKVAHLRVWSGVALSKAEFEAEMVSASAIKTANIYAAYEFANDSGTYLNDSSGNDRHLTGTNIDFATNYTAGPLSAGGSTSMRTRKAFPFSILSH